MAVSLRMCNEYLVTLRSPKIAFSFSIFQTIFIIIIEFFYFWLRVLEGGGRGNKMKSTLLAKWERGKSKIGHTHSKDAPKLSVRNPHITYIHLSLCVLSYSPYRKKVI